MKNYLSIALFIITTSCILVGQVPRKGICAHRGAANSHPENTLSAIEQAVELGVQMIEYDVRSTKDNGLVLMHDKTVDRTTNGKGAVKDLTLSEIGELDAGIWKGEKFKDEKVPTLEEVLDAIPDTILMNIHVKKEFETAIAVARLLTERDQISNAVMAVENDVVDTIRAINRQIKICSMERGNTSEEYVNNAVKVKADFVQLKERSLSNIYEIVSKLKKHNIVVNFYHAESLGKLKILFEAGVDFALTNNPEAMMKAAKENGLVK